MQYVAKLLSEQRTVQLAAHIQVSFAVQAEREILKRRHGPAARELKGAFDRVGAKFQHLWLQRTASGCDGRFIVPLHAGDLAHSLPYFDRVLSAGILCNGESIQVVTQQMILSSEDMSAVVQKKEFILFQALLRRVLGARTLLCKVPLMSLKRRFAQNWRWLKIR